MDSFFAKKGLTLSRTTNTNNQPTREQLLRSQQQNMRPPPHQSANTAHSYHKLAPPESYSPAKAINHSQIVPHTANREEKSFSIGPSIRLMTHHEAESHPPLPKQSQWKFNPAFNPPKPKQGSLNSSREDFNELSKLSIVDPNRSFEGSSSFVERQSTEGRGDTYSEVKAVNKLKMTLEAHRIETESAKLNKNMYMQSSPARPRQESADKARASLQTENFTQRVLNDRITLLQREKEELMQELRKRDGKYVPQEWFEEKYKLLKEINQKNVTIRDLDAKLASTERQLRGKITTLEFQVRMLENSRSKLQSENETNRQQLRSEKEKHEKAKDQINKLIFFEDDLIHAKDYSRLKEQLEAVLTQNALMFQEHQQYIITAGQARRAVTNRLEEVQEQLAALRQEYSLHRSKLEALADNSEDKMQLIKLQNDINFLRKKNEENTEIIIAKEKELEQAKLTIKDLVAQQQNRTQAAQMFMDEANMQQIKDTIATYQARLADFAEALAAKTAQVAKHKAELEALAGEVRAGKEERHITNMKERSSENSLRNEVETLQRALQGEQELSSKRTANLEESLQRKARQIAQKDAFIKNFLLSRAKLLESNGAEGILQAMRQFFAGQAPQ